MNFDEQHFLQTMGLCVRKRREALGWIQAELGEKCEFHRTFIGSVERGERNVSVLNLRAIARALCISPAKLLDDT